MRAPAWRSRLPRHASGASTASAAVNELLTPHTATTGYKPAALEWDIW